VDKDNIVWLNASNITWVDQPGKLTFANGPKVAFLWGEPDGEQLNGTFIKLPAGFKGTIRSNGSIFGAVVIKGAPEYKMSEADTKTLEPGSYFESEGETVHMVSSAIEEETIIYVRTNGKYDIVPAQL
jgi:hypothetical protein